MSAISRITPRNLGNCWWYWKPQGIDHGYRDFKPYHEQPWQWWSLLHCYSNRFVMTTDYSGVVIDSDDVFSLMACWNQQHKPSSYRPIEPHLIYQYVWTVNHDSTHQLYQVSNLNHTTPMNSFCLKLYTYYKHYDDMVEITLWFTPHC